MTTQEVKRKLAAILNADVEGYSYLMGEDEEGTLTINSRRIREGRKDYEKQKEKERR